MRSPLSSLSLFLLCLLIIISIPWILTASGLTELDYHLGKSKHADATVSVEESFHGASSAKLSVDQKGDYIRISVYLDSLDSPLALEDLDRLSMWIDPQEGDGEIQLELFLDGDGDGAYDSDSSRDARLRSIKKSWSSLGMSSSRWNELDGFDLTYEKYGEKTFPASSLDECRSRLGDGRAVKLYITLYKDETVPSTAAFIDYLKIGDQILSFEPLEQEELKKASRSVSPGSEITYTITYGNNQLQPVDLVVTEKYDPRTVFIRAVPMPDPGTTNIWTFRDLPPGGHGQIVIKMKTARPSCQANIRGQVNGQGYASVSGELSTDHPAYQVSNTVTLSSPGFNLTAAAATTVKPIEGSILEYGEHGFGSYRSQEKLVYSSASISAYRDISGNGSNASFGLSPRGVLFQGSWQARLRAENRVRDIGWSERYYEGSLLNVSSRLQLSKSISYLEIEAKFAGMADRASNWDVMVFDQRLRGNFTLKNRAAERWSNRTFNPQDQGLDCCPMVQE